MSSSHCSTAKKSLVAGRYHILRRVGAGEHGVVYEGEDIETGERVAVKQLNHQQGKREAEVLARLTHPLIPAFKALHRWWGASYLGMEWVEGKPLRNYSSRGTGLERLSLAEVFHVGFQLCDVLGYLHTQTPVVLHLDVSLSNVLLRQDRQIMLTDYGQAELRCSTRSSKGAISLDTDDVRLLLFKLLPPETPSELAWQMRGVSSQEEDTDELRAALVTLAALWGERPSRMKLRQKDNLVV